MQSLFKGALNLRLEKREEEIKSRKGPEPKGECGWTARTCT